MNKQIRTSYYRIDTYKKILYHLLFIFSFPFIGISTIHAQAVPTTDKKNHTFYETIKDGDWNKRSTWKDNEVPPNDITRGTEVVLKHHVTHDKGIRIKFQGKLTIISGTLTIEKGGFKLLDPFSELHIERGALIVMKNHVRNQQGIITLNFGGIQVCQGNFTDQTRASGGTFGSGYIYVSGGDIRNQFPGRFSKDIDWCTPNGQGQGLPIESNCELFESLANGNCSDLLFYQTLFDRDGDGVIDSEDIDNDNDGIADAIEDLEFDTYGDEDGDGILNYLDTKDNGNNGDNSNTDYTDSNNDGVPDVYDADLDGIVNAFDLDSDNDGIPDSIEAQSSSTYIFSTSFTDENGNGMDDIFELLEDGSFVIKPVDTDQDGIPDFLDLDSDNDGQFDADESGKNLLDSNSDGRVEGNFGTNGLIADLESSDDYQDVNGAYDNTQLDNFPDMDKDANLGGEVDYRDNEVTTPPMITQIYASPSDRWIEITNPSAVNHIPANRLNITLYNSLLDGIVSVPPISYTIQSDIRPGASALIRNSLASINTISGTAEVNDLITAFGIENTLILSTENGSEAWNNRYDVVSNIENNTSYVRIDFDTKPSKDFISENWIAFTDKAFLLELISSGENRHPNDPLLSEIASADNKANSRLGEHRFGATERINGTWSNGFPDRSREVIISEDYEHILRRLSARTLEVRNNSKLAVNNQALIVSDHIHMNAVHDEIRLIGTAQLLQTHSGDAQVTGEGKFYIDRDTNLKSIYRFNYLSSPVHTGNKTYSIKEVLKDGTNYTSMHSNPQEINFIGGFNSAPTSPISIADYWIYSFGNVNGVGRWIQKRSEGIIPATDGFLMKGPGIWQNYTFVGTPNDGILTTQTTGGQSYFLGNPYPSAINARKFIEDNLDAIDGTLYFWDHVGEQDTTTATSGHNYAGYIGGYAIINLSMSLAANSPMNPAVNVNNIILSEEYKQPKPYIAVGQGFFAAGDPDGGTIVFKNSQREYVVEGEESVFFKANDVISSSNRDEIVQPDLPVLKLGLNYTDSNGAELHRQMGISFSLENSFAHDKGYDSEVNDLGTTDMYWKFPDNDKKYIIAGVESIRSDLRIPLEIIVGTSSEEVKFTIDMIQNIDANLFIYDRMKDVYYSLNDDEASFEVSQGTHAERFYLTFNKNNKIDSQNTFVNTQIFNDQSREELVVRPQTDATINRVELYNVLGKQVEEWTKFSQKGEHRMAVNSLTGFHIVKVYTDKGVVTKKILL